MGAVKVSPHIFRAYDIRGVYGVDLDESLAYSVGRAFGKIVTGKVVVGRDVRRSGESLVKALCDGLTDAGHDVLNLGVCTTPACYFGGRFYRAGGGVMVTASHNPPDWNGFKMFLGDGETVSQGAGMEKIRDMIINGDLGSPAKEKGVVEKVDFQSVYIQHIVSRFSPMYGLRMAADFSDGSASLCFPQMCEKLGITLRQLNNNPDGYFRGHMPEPTEENISELKQVVIAEKLDFGVAFDGDADRAVFVDDMGRVLQGDIAMAVLLKTLDKKGIIVYDVNSSTALKEMAEKLGFTPMEWKVGRAFLHRKVRELGAVMGGEKSNHLYFGELEGDDDAIYAALKMATLLHRTKTSLSKHVDEIPKYPTTPILVYDCPDEKKFAVIEKISERLSQMGFKTNNLDGVKAYGEEGWILIRASNTMPQIKMSIEAKKAESLNMLRQLGERLIREAMETV